MNFTYTRVSDDRSIYQNFCSHNELLEEMIECPPDVLVIQTHYILLQCDLDLICALSPVCELWVSITVEIWTLSVGFHRMQADQQNAWRS